MSGGPIAAGPRGSVGSGLRAPLGTAAVIAAATLALRLHDPHQRGSWGFCPFKLITGWDCPACGGLRAVNDLTHGDLGAAWHSNALFIGALPLIGVAWLLWVRRTVAGPGSARPLTRDTRHVLAALGLAVVVAFTVWRNTPWGSAFHVA